jgi:hypothetical protein
VTEKIVNSLNKGKEIHACHASDSESMISIGVAVGYSPLLTMIHILLGLTIK